MLKRMIKCCLNIPQCLWITLQYNRLKYYKDVSNIVCHKFNPKNEDYYSYIAIKIIYFFQIVN